MRIEDWKAVRLASRTLALLEEKQINAILMAVAEAIPHYMNRILEREIGEGNLG